MRARLQLIKAYVKIRGQDKMAVGVFKEYRPRPYPQKAVYCAIGALPNYGHAPKSAKRARERLQRAAKEIYQSNMYYVNDTFGKRAVEAVYRKAVFSW